MRGRGAGGSLMKGEGGRVRGHLGDLQRHVASLILEPATLVLQQRVQKVRTLKDHKQITCSDLSPLFRSGVPTKPDPKEPATEKYVSLQLRLLVFPAVSRKPQPRSTENNRVQRFLIF